MGLAPLLRHSIAVAEIAAFICAAMTEADIDHTLEVADDAFKFVREAGTLPRIEKLAILGLLTDGH